MYVLGIETSCDETAAAVVASDKTILSNVVLSQLETHEVYGGVVPEIAAREHLNHIDKVVEAAMREAGLAFDDLAGVAATSGPGLIGGVMIGMMTGKAIAASKDLPFMAVNHLEGHALSARLAEDIDFPYLLLLVSGGHTALVEVSGVGQYQTLGTTLDDALGEMFDKSGKIMGLPYPGGPEVEKMARAVQDPEAALGRFPLPTPMKGRKEPDFSFSGLKTAVKHHVDGLPDGPLARKDVADLCYAVQETVGTVLRERCAKALQIMAERHNRPVPLVIAGGVAANKRLRTALADLANDTGSRLVAPPLDLCSDNGAMIAWAGIERLAFDMPFDFDAPARPRWPLDDVSVQRTGRESPENANSSAAKTKRG